MQQFKKAIENRGINHTCSDRTRDPIRGQKSGTLACEKIHIGQAYCHLDLPQATYPEDFAPNTCARRPQIWILSTAKCATNESPAMRDGTSPVNLSASRLRKPHNTVFEAAFLTSWVEVRQGTFRISVSENRTIFGLTSLILSMWGRSSGRCFNAIQWTRPLITWFKSIWCLKFSPLFFFSGDEYLSF
jgi:hypothetical protein